LEPYRGPRFVLHTNVLLSPEARILRHDAVIGHGALKICVRGIPDCLSTALCQLSSSFQVSFAKKFELEVTFSTFFSEVSSVNRTKVTLEDIAYPADVCLASFSGYTWLALAFSLLFWIFRLLKVLYHFVNYYDIKKFYNNALKIEDVCCYDPKNIFFLISHSPTERPRQLDLARCAETHLRSAKSRTNVYSQGSCRARHLPSYFTIQKLHGGHDEQEFATGHYPPTVAGRGGVFEPWP
jgi:Autophagy protein ATG9